MPETTYGTWRTITGGVTSEPADTIRDLCADMPGIDVAAIEREYREAIAAALPEGVTLVGYEFIGPDGFDWAAAGQSVDPFGALDIAEIVNRVDLFAIIARHDQLAEPDPAAPLRAERAELVARLVDVHRRTLATPARINHGDALDLALRTGGVATMRRHGRRVGLAVVNGHLPDNLDRDEAEEVALSLLAAVVNGIFDAPAELVDQAEKLEVPDDAHGARLRTAYETGNHDGDGGPR